MLRTTKLARSICCRLTSDIKPHMTTIILIYIPTTWHHNAVAIYGRNTDVNLPVYSFFAVRCKLCIELQIHHRFIRRLCYGLCLQVVDIMRVNVDKVLERDQKLSELDDRAGLFYMALYLSLYHMQCVFICHFRILFHDDTVTV